ncbi:MAG: 16S rRNA (guanine(966)-N(2))-methyltransferase RsmD [Eubacteriales bacterium]
MRIITGTARGTKLAALEGTATRPTAERLKEAIFSSIQFDIEGREVLDLFAGSGQLGLEALSRGAANAMFVDASYDAITVVKANAQKTHLFDRARFLASDYRSYLRKAAGRDSYGLIFIDPPYAEIPVGEVLERVLEAGVAKPGCLLVCESGEAAIFEGRASLAARFRVLKEGRYSHSYLHILSPVPEDDPYL